MAVDAYAGSSLYVAFRFDVAHGANLRMVLEGRFTHGDGFTFRECTLLEDGQG